MGRDELPTFSMVGVFHEGHTIAVGGEAMPRAFGWFKDPHALIQCVADVKRWAAVSVIIANPNIRSREVLVYGPLSQDLRCYPFLDLLHHIRRLGMERAMAHRYAEVVSSGGMVVCVDDDRANPTTWLSPHGARDLALIR